MIGRLRFALATVLAVALLVPLASVAEAQQQAQQRFRVLVPDVQPAGNADDDFGQDLAENLRERLDELATHRPVSRDDIEDAMDQFDMDWEDLNCIRSRQLAAQIESQVVLCGSYEEVANDEYEVDVQFVVVDNNDTFPIDPFTAGEGEHEQAAQHIFDAFDRLVEQTRATAFCQDYYSSEQYDRALENCERAIELNPESVPAQYTRALTLENQGQLEEALQGMLRVLELDPVHENALQWAGNLSARLDRNDEARDYYQQYLQLNPGDANVRMRIAYELAQAGDPVGAMQLIEEGLELDPENPDLYEQYGNFAFSAARQRMDEAGLQTQARQAAEGQSEQLPADVEEYYNTAIDAYEQVFEMRGDSTNASQLRNVVAANIQLGQNEEAVSFAERALEAHPEAARLWSIYADALRRAGQLDQAIAALDSVQSIDPDYANVAVRQGSWLLEEGRRDEAAERLEEAVERGEQGPDVIARLFLADAHSNGVQAENFGYAIDGLELAKQFDVSPSVQAELDFWHGWSLYQQAMAEQEAETVESAEATLPMFRQARELFQNSEDYANQQSSIDLDQILEATDTYIEIQEAIIQRGSS